MSKGIYPDERNAQILIALLKAYNIRHIVASPGSTHIAFVGSVQNDPFFKVWSAVDERHAAYLACGMAAQSDEPVVIVCTGATAARNYMPGMTEAYYRKLPILCLTCSKTIGCNGQLIPEATDRSRPPSDVAKVSVTLHPVMNDYEAFGCEAMARNALMELFGATRGPVHINMETLYRHTFTVEKLPTVRVVKRYYPWNGAEWPAIPKDAKVLVYMGSGRKFSKDDVRAFESFAARHNVVALIDQTSPYKGKYAVCASVACIQKDIADHAELAPDIIIHVGEISGDYVSSAFVRRKAPVWRVNADGRVRDVFWKIDSVFATIEAAFFAHYGKGVGTSSQSYLKAWQSYERAVRKCLPDVPFSSVWIAQAFSTQLPKGSVLHLGILNSLRAWNYLPKLTGVEVSSNVGGFGIDGCTSALLGASLVAPNKLCFLVTGDLAFFYDLNALGNRHVGKNVRILLVNNGAGSTFNMYFNPGRQFGSHTNDYIAAGGHFGKMSRNLVRHYAQDLGFKYLAATDKASFEKNVAAFVAPDSQVPILMECFVDLSADTAAVEMIDGRK